MHNETTTDITDLTKAVMTDETGKWHLVPAEHVNNLVSSGRNSVVVHQCPEWSEDVRSPVKELPYEPLGYWTLPKHMTAPCMLCAVHVPEKIASLFMLHNFDTFAGDGDGFDLGRIISTSLNQAFSHFDHTYMIRDPDHPCTCRLCYSAYGALE